MPHSRGFLRHHTERVVANRLRFIQTLDPGQYDRPHMFAKKKPLDCGVSHCRLCHPYRPQEKYHHDYLWEELEGKVYQEDEDYWDAVWEDLYRSELYGDEGDFSDLPQNPKRDTVETMYRDHAYLWMNLRKQEKDMTREYLDNKREELDKMRDGLENPFMSDNYLLALLEYYREENDFQEGHRDNSN